MAIHAVKDGRFVEVNQACASFGGFKREDLIGHTMSEFSLLEDPEQVEKVARKLREEGKIHNMESQVRTRDGEVRTVLFSADPVSINGEECLLGVSVDITEREKEAGALRQSEEKYRMLVENSLQGLAIYQGDSLVFCNSRFAEMLGSSIGELQSLSLEELLQRTFPEMHREVLQRYRAQWAGQQAASHHECRGMRADGVPIWLEEYARRIQYHGTPALQAVYMDITDRKNAENALRESEERFRLIAETIDEIFYIYDAEKQVTTYLSPAYDRIWGYPRECVMGNPDFFMEPVHPDDRGHVLAEAARLRSGQPISHEYRIIRPDGSMRHIWERAFPVAGENGKARLVIGVGQDVTARHEAAEALKETKEYLHQIINRIGDPIFVKDCHHRVMLVNDALCGFSGKSRADLIGTATNASEPFWMQEESVLETGKEILTEDTLQDAKGTKRTFLTKKTLLTDKNGKRQIVGVLRDITEYKRLENQFLQSQKMEAIGVLAGGVAHDFNNLLNVINGYTELILSGLEDEAPLRKDLEEVWTAGQRAAALTSQLLAFGRKQILQPETIDLNQVISGMGSMLNRMIGEDIDFIFKPQAPEAWIHADPAKLQQVLMNLVVNARDAMPDGGKLTIETAGIEFEEGLIREHPVDRSGPHIMLAVSDSGVGMDAETQAHLFEPFFTTKSKGKGTGLGMSTVYGIVRQSGGFIWVYSEPGKGTTIKIYFPRAAAKDEPAPAEAKVGYEAQGSETILVAEDEIAVRGLATRILRHCGYSVLEASDGVEALRISREYPEAIHLVVSDVVMPGLGGKGLVAQLKDARPGIRALFISGYTDNVISHHGILDSNIDFLQKPFTIEGLIRKVREVLDSEIQL